MDSQQKRRRVSVEKFLSVSIETLDEDDKPASINPPKKRRGRPKAGPKSIELPPKPEPLANVNNTRRQETQNAQLSPPSHTAHASPSMSNADTPPQFDPDNLFPELPPTLDGFDQSGGAHPKQRSNKVCCALCQILFWLTIRPAVVDSE